MEPNVEIQILNRRSNGVGATLGRIFSPSSSTNTSPAGLKRQHADPKQVFEGLEGASLQAALNQPKQLEHMLGDRSNMANFQDPDGDRYPLHWAAVRGYSECVRLLLMNGAQPDVLDASGRTPAQLAREFGQPEMLVLLGGE